MISTNIFHPICQKLLCGFPVLVDECFPGRHKWWQERFNQKLTLSQTTILYDWNKESNKWEVLKYCLIVAKYNDCFCNKRTQQHPGL